MKRSWKIKSTAVILAAVMLFSVFGAGTVEANADTAWLEEGVKQNDKDTIYIWQKDEIYEDELSYVLFPLSKNVSVKKVKNVRSSNKKVLEVTRIYNKRVGKKKAVVMDVWAKKTGTATVTFKYNTKTYKLRYTIKKASNGLKSVRISGVSGDYAPKFNAHWYCDVKNKKVPANVKITARPNWKIKKVTVTSMSALDGKTIFKSSKGKTSVTVKDKAFRTIMEIEIECHNGKTGEEEVYRLQFGADLR